MATISKFYLLDAITPNSGIMPSSFPAGIGGDGYASDALTIRDATDVHGSSNPDLEATITANANQNLQGWGLRIFVSRPLAAQTIVNGQSWTFSCADQESNNAHNGHPRVSIQVWRPSTGARVGTGGVTIQLGEPGLSETALNGSDTWVTSTTIQDGDILVFYVDTVFTQSMSSAYTESWSYNGVTEADITSCASFVTPPSALTLFSQNIYTKAGYAKEGVAA